MRSERIQQGILYLQVVPMPQLVKVYEVSGESAGKW